MPSFEIALKVREKFNKENNELFAYYPYVYPGNEVRMEVGRNGYPAGSIHCPKGKEIDETNYKYFPK